jgi:hypothetical protein
MSVDPKIALWLNALYLVLTGLSAPMLQAAGIADASHVIGIAALVAFPLNIVLHTVSSSASGPLAAPTLPTTVAEMKTTAGK